DGGGDLERRRGVGDALPVVARGGGHDAGGPLFGVEAHALGQRAPDLEGADGLDRFDLDVDVAARLVGERARVLEGRRRQVAGKVPRRPVDVVFGAPGGSGLDFPQRSVNDRWMTDDLDRIEPREGAHVRARDKKVRGPKVVAVNPGLKKLTLHIAERTRKKRKTT